MLNISIFFDYKLDDLIVIKLKPVINSNKILC